nr:neurogenic protein mastermind [Ipomoea batatas]
MSPTPLSIPPLPFFPKQHLIKSSNLHSQTLKEPSFHYLSSSAMKKLYRKGTVFPSPPLVSDQLAFLPAAIFTLTAALSQEDKQVLAYLLSCPSGNFSTTHKNSSPSGKGGGGADRPPSFSCFCFNCYRSYWASHSNSSGEVRKSEVMMGLNKEDSGEADAAAALPSHGGGCEGEEEGGEKGSVRRLWVKAVNEHKRTAYICPGEQGRMDG